MEEVAARLAARHTVVVAPRYADSQEVTSATDIIRNLRRLWSATPKFPHVQPPVNRRESTELFVLQRINASLCTAVSELDSRK